MCTNNIIEYETLLTGIREAIKWKIKHLHVYGDSQLVVKQVNVKYETKYDKLVSYKNMVDTFKEYFVEITFEHIP